MCTRKGTKIHLIFNNCRGLTVLFFYAILNLKGGEIMQKILYYISLYKKKIILFSSILVIIIACLCFFFINRRFNSEIISDKSFIVDNSSKKTDSSIKVDVKGAVNNPGVYEINMDDRVVDAINKAGGFMINAYELNLNLAKKLVDESVIIVNTKEEVEYYKLSKTPIVCENADKLYRNGVCELYNIAELSDDDVSSNSSVSINNDLNTLVNINTASAEVLSSLEGIGASKAQSIIRYRENNGPFTKKEDLLKVEGIGDKLYEAIKEFIRV